jgi:hypothetical protein
LLATCVIFVTSEVLQIIAFTWQFSPNVRDLYLYHNDWHRWPRIWVSPRWLG